MLLAPMVSRRATAVLLAPGNVPVFFDHEDISQVIGDVSKRGAEAG